MHEVEKLAKYIHEIKYEDLSQEVIWALKIRILDSLAVAIGALDYPLMKSLKKHIDDFGGAPIATLIGGGRTSPDRVAFFNSALVRFLDFNDSFLAKKETCHPSDNLGSVLAACEYAKTSGEHFLLALALAYQVQCRLSEEAPVRDKGFDHTTQGAYAVSASVSKALHLTKEQTANAIAMAGVANNALRVTRTGALSHWKGLAYPQTAFSATHASFLALRNITGPLEIFEGNKGFKHTIAGQFKIDWTINDLDIVLKTIIKKFNAEIHSQSTLEGIIELRTKYKIDPKKVKSIHIETFDVAFNIIGGGEEGGKKLIRTKEEADHSLPYMVAAALIDGEVTPKQYEESRIGKNDIQTLLKKIEIRPNEKYSGLFPRQMACHVLITLEDGKKFDIEKRDYEGFVTKPMTWEHIVDKFNTLTEKIKNKELLKKVIETVYKMETVEIASLAKLLGEIKL